MTAIGFFNKAVDLQILRPGAKLLSDAIRHVIANWEWYVSGGCFLSSAIYVVTLVFVTHHFFWDFQQYVADINSMAEGISPYNVTAIAAKYGTEISPFPFSYPPLIAAAFLKGQWLLNSSIGHALLIVALGTSWIAIPYLLANRPSDWYRRHNIWIFGLYLALFGFGGIKVFASGNIAGVLAASEIAAIVAAVRLKNYRAFWAVTFICSYIKLYFLAFLLIPIALDKKYLSACIFLVVFIASYSLNYFIYPQLFVEFVNGVALISRDSNAIGRSLYTLAYRAVLFIHPGAESGAAEIALVMHAVFCLFVIFLARAVFEKSERPTAFGELACWLFVSAFLISPRLVDYDIPVLVVPCAILARMLLVRADPAALAVGAMVTVAGSTLMRTAFSDWSPSFIILGVWLGAAVHLLQPPVLATAIGSHTPKAPQTAGH